jgi:hypothetical protein
LAPWTTAPVGSVKMPLTVPKYAWPKSMTGNVVRITTTNIRNGTLRLFRPDFASKVCITTSITLMNQPFGATAQDTCAVQPWKVQSSQ